MPEQEGKEELVSPHREGSYWVTPQMREWEEPLGTHTAAQGKGNPPPSLKPDTEVQQMLST